MSLSYKADHSFGEIKKAAFEEGATPYQQWRQNHNEDHKTIPSEVDVLEHLRFNIEQLTDLNSRFQFLLEELSTVLVKRK
jgi:hypothetical protein